VDRKEGERRDSKEGGGIEGHDNKENTKVRDLGGTY